MHRVILNRRDDIETKVVKQLAARVGALQWLDDLMLCADDV